MPVKEVMNIDLGTTTANLDKLDKMSAKAAKQLEKQRKALEKAQQQQEKGGGIFGSEILPSGSAPSDLQPLSKRDQKIQKKLRKLEEKIRKDEAKQLGNKSFLAEIFGRLESNNIFSFGKNPAAFLTNVLKAVPILGGVLAAKEIAEFIVDEISKIDRFLKVFIDVVDQRMDRFRSLQDQAEIQAGLQQRIITTSFGTTEPRYAYNTFEEFNNNRRALEEEFQMTNNTGVE